MRFSFIHLYTSNWLYRRQLNTHVLLKTHAAAYEIKDLQHMKGKVLLPTFSFVIFLFASSCKHEEIISAFIVIWYMVPYTVRLVIVTGTQDMWIWATERNRVETREKWNKSKTKSTRSKNPTIRQYFLNNTPFVISSVAFFVHNCRQTNSDTKILQETYLPNETRADLAWYSDAIWFLYGFCVLTKYDYYYFFSILRHVVSFLMLTRLRSLSLYDFIRWPMAFYCLSLVFIQNKRGVSSIKQILAK